MSQKLLYLVSFALVLGLIGAAEAAFDTVGVYDPDDAPHHNQVDQSGAYDSHTGNAGPENVIDLATFQELIGPAFAADAGGVVSGESPDDSLGSDDIVIAHFGINSTKSVSFASSSGNLAFGTGSNGDGSSSGNRLPLSGINRFARSSGDDFTFSIGEVIGGEPGEVITYFAGSLVERDNRNPMPVVTATFSDGSTVTATADMAGDNNSPNNKDTFFGFKAPEGTSIVSVDFLLNELILLDDVAFITSAFVVVSEEASDPSPANEVTDVPRDVVLSWTVGGYADKHNVYFGTDFDNVSNANTDSPLLVGPGLDPNTFDPGRLDFGQTYYWRTDEVNAPPDLTVFNGDVWSFTTEPAAYAIENITATASSSYAADQGPENTINGLGLDVNDLHSTEAADMWLSSVEPNAWIEYELDKVHKLHEMWVWNCNQVMELMFGLGYKGVSIEYSVNGTDYTTLAGVPEFAQASAASDYTHNTTVDFGGAAAKYIRLTANSNWGGVFKQYGLSEVRFFSIPVFAREPSPDSGATDVDVNVALGFRAGREADTHDVYLSNDEQAVIDGNAPVTTVTEASYGPLSLDLDTTYYWKINEVNEAEATTTWQGEIWNFSTPEFFVVDDFEDYNDWPPDEIWSTWVDGYGVPENGATVGYPAPDFLAGENYVETVTVHGGEQAMPFFYDNTGAAAYSEGERTFAVPQDWTKNGVKTLSLCFSGDPNNTAVQMYAKLNGVKVVYGGDAGNLARAGWQAWNIELASFGADLASVTRLAIGFGDEMNVTPGGSGVVYFDDIRLYPLSPELITPVQPNSANLAAHWQFEGNADDISGQGHHGTLLGNPTYLAGKAGQAMTFNGDGDMLTHDLVLSLAQGTVAHWLKADQLRRMAAYYEGNSLNNGWGNGDNAPSLLELHSGMHNDAGQWSFYYQDGPGTGGDARAVVTGGTGQIGVWTHVAATWDTSGELILYVDGVEVDTADLTEENFVSNTGIHHLIGGVSESNSGRDWDGAIDDVRIYDYALSDAEVGWLAGRTKPFDKPF